LAYPRLPKYFHSSRRFRIFFIKEDVNKLRVSISKKNFKLAVDRNKIKRQIKDQQKAQITPPAMCALPVFC